MRFDLIGHLILKYYAPTKQKYGIHFKSYDDTIFTPVVRKEVRDSPSINLGHYTVYLPAYSDEFLISMLAKISHVTWHIFSKYTKQIQKLDNIIIYPVSHKDFIQSMASSAGVLCGAGFETPAEALFLQKKLFVIPIKGQYEQQCNAEALKAIGVPVLDELLEEDLEVIKAWIMIYDGIQVNYPDNTKSIVEKVISDFEYKRNQYNYKTLELSY